MPMQSAPQMNDIEEEPQMPMQDEPNMMDEPEGTSEFDTDFDAGVEADEETDPKKYIQQLTGKLSQTLNTYNNENGEPDTELGKYVLGMLVKQGTKGMDEKDRKEIIKKINTSNPQDDNTEDEMVDDVNNEMDDEPNHDMDSDMTVESRKINFTKKQIFENFGIVNDVDNQQTVTNKIDTKIPKDTVRNNRTRPFEAPKKFK
jgi:hypothetical protein